MTKIAQNLGKAIGVFGLAISAAFVGPGTANPVASWFIQPLTIWIQILGIVTGIAIIAIGARIAGRMSE